MTEFCLILFHRLICLYEKQINVRSKISNFDVRFLSFILCIVTDDNFKYETLLRILCNNLVGSVAGMYFFKKYLHGTHAQKLIACWLHVQAFRKTKDNKQRKELFAVIRKHYLKPTAFLIGYNTVTDVLITGKKERKELIRTIISTFYVHRICCTVKAY